MVNLVAAMVLARLFTKTEYATYRQTFLVYRFSAPLLMLGLPMALYYFLTEESNKPRQILMENVLMLFMGGGLLALFLLLGGADYIAYRFSNPSLRHTLKLIAPYAIFVLPATAFGPTLISRDRVNVAAIYNFVSRAFTLGTVLISVFFLRKVMVAVGAMVGASILTSVIALFLMFHTCNKGPWHPTLSGMKRQLSYSFPVGLSQIIGTMSRDIDKIIVSSLCAPSVFAGYINGAMEVPFIGILTGSVTSVLVVDYTKLYREGKVDEIVRLIHQAMFKTGMVLIPLMFFLFLIAPEIMVVLFGSKYAISAQFFRVYLLLLPVRTLTFGSILRATGRTWPILGQPLLTLPVNAIFSWWGVKYYGPLAAAVVTVITTYTIAVPYYMLWVRKVLAVPIRALFPWKRLLSLILYGGISLLVALIGLTIWRPINPVVVILWAGSLFGISLCLIYAKVGLIGSIIKIK